LSLREKSAVCLQLWLRKARGRCCGEWVGLWLNEGGQGELYSNQRLLDTRSKKKRQEGLGEKSGSETKNMEERREESLRRGKAVLERSMGNFKKEESGDTKGMSA